MIDSHHHFWHYSAREYGWISDSMAILRRDFLPADLLAETHAAGITGVVSVQARQTLAETDWLLDLAEAHDFIQGVVGWVPLISPTVTDDLQRCATRQKLKAVRHVLQDEPDDDYMLRDDFNRGIALLKDFSLAYDILIYERHLPQTIRLVDRHPQQRFILDHIAKPRIRDNTLEPWRKNLQELARRPNVFCKLSGMATEADHHAWTPQQLRPYADAALEAFGPGRLMFGSDWPVCLLACGYGRWLEVVKQFAAEFSAAEQKQLFEQTAVRAYGLA